MSGMISFFTNKDFKNALYIGKCAINQGSSKKHDRQSACNYRVKKLLAVIATQGMK